MNKFYYTYGTEGQPFVGGWSTVIAPDLTTANILFRMAHPDKEQGFLNCASVYDEAHFKETEMYKTGNFDAKEREIIKLSVKVISSESETDNMDKIRAYDKPVREWATTLFESDLKELSTDEMTVTDAFIINNHLAHYLIGYFDHNAYGKTHVYKFYYDWDENKMSSIHSIECDEDGDVEETNTEIGNAAINGSYTNIPSQAASVKAMTELIKSVQKWCDKNKEKFKSKCT